MRVMGVDPGLTRCGLSVVENRSGRQIIALDVDVVRTLAAAPLPQRRGRQSIRSPQWSPKSLGCKPNRRPPTPPTSCLPPRSVPTNICDTRGHHAHGMAMLLFTHRDDASSVSWCYADNRGDR